VAESGKKLLNFLPTDRLLIAPQRRDEFIQYAEDAQRRALVGIEKGNKQKCSRFRQSLLFWSLAARRIKKENFVTFVELCNILEDTPVHVARRFWRAINYRFGSSSSER